ncbi:hypothetical protein PENSOL_c007G04949 [Penicillium solitum]|uniref:Uncharacterized protein n=1 Tax=Penicillium solitum TaxID=60172 RepID=A0A1V6RC88_9EURO|nr:uncharacterized protein PENSOL_c007G04949 [Penicillium solitum]OQD99148.1 hypothetical protein PENSOL_c007G04949 [Penicillium solitum]
MVLNLDYQLANKLPIELKTSAEHIENPALAREHLTVTSCMQERPSRNPR